MKITLTPVAASIQRDMVLESMVDDPSMNSHLEFSKHKLPHPSTSKTFESGLLERTRKYSAATRLSGTGGLFSPPLTASQSNLISLPTVSSKSGFNITRTVDMSSAKDPPREIEVLHPKVRISRYFRYKYGGSIDENLHTFTDLQSPTMGTTLNSGFLTPFSMPTSPLGLRKPGSRQGSAKDILFSISKLHNMNSYNAGVDTFANPEKYVEKSITLKNLQRSALHDELALQKLELKLKKLIQKHNMHSNMHSNICAHIKTKQSNIHAEMNNESNFSPDYESTKAKEIFNSASHLLTRQKSRTQTEYLQKYHRIWIHNRIRKGFVRHRNEPKVKFEVLKKLNPKLFTDHRQPY